MRVKFLAVRFLIIVKSPTLAFVNSIEYAEIRFILFLLLHDSN